jgi:hypothetical protein
LNQLYLKNKTFGEIAVGFVQAANSGKSKLQTYIFETLGEEFYSEKTTIEAGNLGALVKPYAKGTRWTTLKTFTPDEIGKQSKIFVGVDVQTSTNGIWYLVSEVSENGNIGILDYGNKLTFEDIEAELKKYKADYVFVDANFATRKMEVYEYSKKFGYLPVIGRDSSNLGIPFSVSDIDPFAGKRQGGRGTIKQIQFQVEPIKDEASERLLGRHKKQIFLYANPEFDLVDQLTSEEFRDGSWVQIKKDNHLWDCLCYIIIGATVIGFNRHS